MEVIPLCIGGEIGKHAAFKLQSFGLRVRVSPGVHNTIDNFFIESCIYKIKMEVTDEMIIEVCNRSLTMSKACSELGMNGKTFTKRAKALNVYKPNKGGKGTNKKDNGNKIPLNEILEGKFPQYQTNKLRIRLIKEGVKLNCCEICNLSEWNNLPIPLELNHIDGNSHNHILSNLEIICPNCHAQTSTYRGKNIKNSKWSERTV
jgi:hypothetical protein